MTIVINKVLLIIIDTRLTITNKHKKYKKYGKYSLKEQHMI